MRIILTAITVLFLAVSAAHPLEVTIPITVTFISAFELGSVQGAQIGSLISDGSQETIIVDASGIVPPVSSSDQAATASAAELLDDTVLRRNGTVDSNAKSRAGFVVLGISEGSLNIQTAVLGSPQLNNEAGTSRTPISVTGVTTNADQIKAISATEGAYVPLFIGPILQVPEGLEFGDYVGEITVSLDAM